MNKKVKTDRPLTSRSLFLVFLKVGTLVLGGGPIILEAFRSEIVNMRQWMTAEEFALRLPIVQSLPGPFGLNGAFMLGHLLLKKKGALLGIIGILFPSTAIILVLNLLVSSQEFIPILSEKFLYGVNLAASGLVFLMALDLLRRFLKKKVPIAIFLITLIGVLVFKLTPLIFIAMAIIIGVLVALIGGKTDDIS